MIDPAFHLGDRVFLKVGEERGMVVGIYYAPGSIRYEVTWSDASTCLHYEMEISYNKEDWSA